MSDLRYWSVNVMLEEHWRQSFKTSILEALHYLSSSGISANKLVEVMLKSLNVPEDEIKELDSAVLVNRVK